MRARPSARQGLAAAKLPEALRGLRPDPLAAAAAKWARLQAAMMGRLTVRPAGVPLRACTSVPPCGETPSAGRRARAALRPCCVQERVRQMEAAVQALHAAVASLEAVPQVRTGTADPRNVLRTARLTDVLLREARCPGAARAAGLRPVRVAGAGPAVDGQQPPVPHHADEHRAHAAGPGGRHLCGGAGGSALARPELPAECVQGEPCARSWAVSQGWRLATMRAQVSKRAAASALVGLLAGPASEEAAAAAEAAAFAAAASAPHDSGAGPDAAVLSAARCVEARGRAVLAAAARAGGGAGPDGASRLSQLCATYISVWMLNPHVHEPSVEEALGAVTEDMTGF
jgi:hypothetical protein